MRRGNLGKLGKLEAAVMEAVWRAGNGTVREVRLALGPYARAYTTIMTTMDRLFQKGMLQRAAEGAAYRHQPALRRSEYWSTRAKVLMRDLIDSGGADALTASVDAASDEDDDALETLAALIEQKRREQD